VVNVDQQSTAILYNMIPVDSHLPLHMYRKTARSRSKFA